MKKIVTKNMIRSEMDQQVHDYLNGGGQVQSIDRGISGRENPNAALQPHYSNFEKKPEDRTPLTDVVSALDDRAKKQKVASVKPKKKKSVRKPIYDDFGEIMRWEWVDE